MASACIHICLFIILNTALLYCPECHSKNPKKHRTSTVSPPQVTRHGMSPQDNEDEGPEPPIPVDVTKAPSAETPHDPSSQFSKTCITSDCAKHCEGISSRREHDVNGMTCEICEYNTTNEQFYSKHCHKNPGPPNRTYVGPSHDYANDPNYENRPWPAGRAGIDRSTLTTVRTQSPHQTKLHHVEGETKQTSRRPSTRQYKDQNWSPSTLQSKPVRYPVGSAGGPKNNPVLSHTTTDPYVY